MSDRRLAAVMVTDVVGFTTLMEADSDKAVQLLSRSHEILKSLVAKHGGELLDDATDRTQSAFPSAMDAIRCALEVQAYARDAGELDFRVGIDVGEIVGSGRHVYGEPLIVASLIERLADPDGVIITKAAYDAVKAHLELDALDLGEKVLKNIARPVKLYALTGKKRRSRASTLASELVARRVPHIAGAYLAASWLIVEVTEWLAERGFLGGEWPYTILVGLVALIPSVLLIAYLHGAHGRDRFRESERIGVPINVLAAVALAVLVHQNVSGVPGGAPIGRASVAVLPFINLDDAEGSDYFGRGFAEDLIDALGRVPGLYVSSHTSSFIFEGRDAAPRDIARMLRVATIIEGSVRREGEMIHVTVTLVGRDDDDPLWSETFDRELAEIFSIYAEIARAVERELVGSPSSTVFAEARAASVDAYEYYVEGLGYLRQPPTTENLSNARDFLTRALEEDDTFARAYAALCEVALAQYVLDRSPASIDAAESECLRAVRLDNRSREVRQALGTLNRYTGDYAASEREFQQLLSERTTPQALAGLASTLEAQGNYALAENYLLDAVGLEPGNWQTLLALGEFYYWRCRYEDSLRVLRQVLALSPGNARAHLVLGAAYAQSGNTEASLRETSKAIEISPSRGAYRDLGLIYHSVGRYDDAAAAFLRALELGEDDHATWGSLGETYDQIDGQAGAALMAYMRAVELAEDLLARNPRDWMTLANLAVYDLHVGAEERARTNIETAVANGPDNPDVLLADAVVKTRLGQSEQALDSLERATEFGCFPKWMIAGDPRFGPLNGNERFDRLVAE